MLETLIETQLAKFEISMDYAVYVCFIWDLWELQTITADPKYPERNELKKGSDKQHFSFPPQQVSCSFWWVHIYVAYS